MKRFFLFISIYAIFLCIPIKAETPSIQYKIFSDAKEKKVYKYKEEVLNILDYLCRGVDEDSYGTLIKEKVSIFESIENSKVTFKKNTLYISIGDGKGKRIKGNYTKNNICYEEVKPKSKIIEMLGIGNK